MVETTAAFELEHFKRTLLLAFPLWPARVCALYIRMKPVSLWNSSNLPDARTGRLRRLWLNVHLCIGLGIAVLLVPVSLSGAVLVWHDQLEAVLNPDRYAVTQGTAQPPAALLKSAQAALGDGFEPVAVRMPEDAGSPAT